MNKKLLVEIAKIKCEELKEFTGGEIIDVINCDEINKEVIFKTNKYDEIGLLKIYMVKENGDLIPIIDLYEGNFV